VGAGDWAALVTCVVVFGYLCYALFTAERF
jgi:K+-transporting ATPase KdpF subunit